MSISASSLDNSFLPNALFTDRKKNAPHVIAVGGGKGGVGKSSIALMMGLYLAEKGKETVLVDADLTGANLHGYLGVWNSKDTLHSFLKGSTGSLNDLVQTTSFARLSAIVGALGMNCAESHRTYDTRRLVNGLHELPADYVIVDLGAEGSAIEIDLFLAAETNLVVSSSDSLSLHNVFNFIRSALLRKIRKQWSGQSEMLEKLSNFIQETDTKGAQSIEQAFKKWGYDSQWVRAVAQTVRPKILVNMTEETDSSEALQSLRISVSRLLSTHVDFWGIVHTDEHVRQAIRSFNPKLLCSQDNRAFADIRKVIDRQLLRPSSIPVLFSPEQMQAKKTAVKNFLRGTLCSTRCLAWRSCIVKNGGMPCAMKPADVLSREACYA
jgi:flagellar biosynthesis protein FlhG